MNNFVQGCFYENKMGLCTTRHSLGTDRATESQCPSPLLFFSFFSELHVQKHYAWILIKKKFRGRIFLSMSIKQTTQGLPMHLAVFPFPGPSRSPSSVHRPVAVKSYNSWDSMAILLLYLISVSLDWSLHTTVSKGQESDSNSGSHVLIPVLTGVSKKI